MVIMVIMVVIHCLLFFLFFVFFLSVRLNLRGEFSKVASQLLLQQSEKIKTDLYSELAIEREGERHKLLDAQKG